MTAVLVAVCASAAAAQDTARVAPAADTSAMERPYRSPSKARVWGTILPGAGHIYAGEYIQGASLYVATVWSIGMGPVIYGWDGCEFTFLSDKRCTPHAGTYRAVGLAMIGLGVATWVFSSIDSPRAAKRANERHRAERLRRASSKLDVGVTARLEPWVGVAVTW